MNQPDFEKLVASLQQKAAQAEDNGNDDGKGRRREFPGPHASIGAEDIRAIRCRLDKSQEEFALMIGVSTRTLQHWETGRRLPDGPARALLRVAAHAPDAVAKALGPR